MMDKLRAAIVGFLVYLGFVAFIVASTWIWALVVTHMFVKHGGG